MKTGGFKKVSALLLAFILVFTSFIVPKEAQAGLGYWPEDLEIPNEWYYKNETLQPYGTCLHVGELLNWSPDNDPDARYNRSSIPLQPRFMGPSVNPKASREATVYPLAMSNARASEAPSQGGDGDFVYAFNNFQYINEYNFWGGSSAEGPIAIPSPEHIDSAHRNGVAATATIFLPWGDGAFGNKFVSELVKQDAEGNFPAADKLIEIAQYYGFDGYMFNTESGSSVPNFREFLIYLNAKSPENFTLTWYNGSGSLSPASVSSWMQAGDKRITDAWWLDMSGAGRVDETIAAVTAAGRSQWEIYSTWEYIPMEPGAKGGVYQTRLDENGFLKTSLGILAPTSTLTQSADSSDFINVQDQKVWVGPTFDPSSTYRPQNEFCGFANMIADKSPVMGEEFVTHFTTGNGYKFYENGQVTGKENGWYNRSLTDVLPTWRWIIDSEEGASKLEPLIDFDTAYWGGTSMKVSGKLDANKANNIKLYSTQLDITEDSVAEVIYKTPDAKDVELSLGLCFGEDYSPENFKYYPVETTGDGSWKSSKIDLAGDAGKKAIAISLKFESSKGVEDYEMNIGRLGITTSNPAPKATSNITIDEVMFKTDTQAELRAYWDKVDGALFYIVHRVHKDGSREFIGATPNNAYYFGEFDRLEDDETKFEITTISKNGVYGGTAEMTLTWPERVEGGFEPVFDSGENIALKKPAYSNVAMAADGPVDKINDGVIPSSKWCGLSSRGSAYLDLGKEYDISRWVVKHANVKGAGEGVDMNTVDFNLEYAPDDGHPSLSDPDSSEDQSRIFGLDYTVADEVRGNKRDITDRNLDEPIRARYIRLNVLRSDNSPWSAIRIYEFELYEKPGEKQALIPTPTAKSVTVKNNPGAKDTVVIDNVEMPFASGQYPGGSIAANTGKVYLYDSADASEAFATAQAEQPTTLYKQYSLGIAKFTGLNLNPQGGRIWYEVEDTSEGESKMSRRFSIYYPPEDAEKASPGEYTLVKSSRGKNLNEDYGVLTVTGLTPGAQVFLYDSDNSIKSFNRSNPADENGKVTIEYIKLDSDETSFFYEVREKGKSDSDRVEVNYSNLEAGNQDDLQELINRYEDYDKSLFTSESWAPFAKALQDIRDLKERGNATAEEIAEVRQAIQKAERELERAGDIEPLKKYLAKVKEDYLDQEEIYSIETYQVLLEEIEKTEKFIEDFEAEPKAQKEVDKRKVALEGAVARLELKALITEEIVPDDALRQAIIDQVGSQLMEKISIYDGKLDLSEVDYESLEGLDCLEKLKVLDLSNYREESLDEEELPDSLEELIINNSEAIERLELDLEKLSNLRQLQLLGTTGLKVIDIPNGNLELVEFDQAEKYQDLVYFDISNNKLDASENTPEGALSVFVEDRLEQGLLEGYKLPIENLALEKPITADNAPGVYGTAYLLVDGNRNNSYYMGDDHSVTIDLGKDRKIDRIEVYLSYFKAKALKSTFEYAPDGGEFVTADLKNLNEYTPEEDYVAKIELEEPIEGRYFKFTQVQGNDFPYYAEIELWGQIEIDPFVKYDGQNPEIDFNLEDLTDETVLVYEDTVTNLMDLAESIGQNQGLTARGNTYESIKNEAWLAEDYQVKEIELSIAGLEEPYEVTGVGKGQYDVTYKLGEEEKTITISLKLDVDRRALMEAILEAEELDRDKFTPASLERLDEVLDMAKRIADDPQATQEAIDQALEDLNQAIEDLVAKANKDQLQEVYEAAEKITEEELARKTKKSARELRLARREAESVLADENASQEEVDAAAQRLLNAIAGLEDYVEGEDHLERLELIRDILVSINRENLDNPSIRALDDIIDRINTALEEKVDEEEAEALIAEAKTVIENLKAKVYVNGYASTYVYYRQGPGTGFDKAGILSKGVKVDGVLDGNWVEFEKNGQKYYVHKHFVRPTPITTVKYARFDQFVRDLDGNKIGIIKKNTEVAGRVIGKRVYFEFEGKDARLYLKNLMDEPLERYYLLSDSQAFDVDGKKLAELSKGDFIDGVRVGEYVKTKIDGETAYVKAINLTKTPVPVTLTATSSVFVRDKASNTGNKIGIVKKGAVVQGIRKGAWLEFKFEGKTGYSAGKYFK